MRRYILSGHYILTLLGSSSHVNNIMSWDEILGNFIASIAGRTAFYYLRKWLEGRNISISIGKIKKDYMVDTFVERGQVFVGFHNGKIPLEAFSVEYDDAGCPWWDNNSIEPRNLYAGGG